MRMVCRKNPVVHNLQRSQCLLGREDEVSAEAVIVDDSSESISRLLAPPPPLATTSLPIEDAATGATAEDGVDSENSPFSSGGIELFRCLSRRRFFFFRLLVDLSELREDGEEGAEDEDPAVKEPDPEFKSTLLA